MSEEGYRTRLKLLEKEITKLKGKEKKAVAAEYFRVLHSCGKKCLDDEPIYFSRA